GNKRLLDGRSFRKRASCATRACSDDTWEANPLMHSPRRSVVLVLAIALLAPPAIARADKCGGTKLKSSGDAISKTLECDSKAESKGKAPDAPCDAKPGANVAKEFAKADRRLSCPGSASAVVSALGTCESNVLAAVGASESSPTESKCDSKKVAAA